jgi:hypothetical protein
VDLVVLSTPADLDEVLPAARKAPQALAVLALVVGLMVSGIVPNVQAALLGCLLMGLLGCVDLNSAYRSISWQTLVLMVGMLPFSIALQWTGGVDLAADALVAAVGEAAPRLVLGSLFVITTALGLFISNTATAVLMAPVVLVVAGDLGASPYPVRDDRGPGGVDRVHDPGLIAREHPGRGAGQLRLWRLRAHRSAVHRDRARRLRAPGAPPAAAALAGPGHGCHDRRFGRTMAAVTQPVSGYCLGRAAPMTASDGTGALR